MMRRPGRSPITAVFAGLFALSVAGQASGDSKLRAVVIMPFDGTALEREEQWMGEAVV